jgi:hypothetical protein
LKFYCEKEARLGTAMRFGGDTVIRGLAEYIFDRKVVEQVAANLAALPRLEVLS